MQRANPDVAIIPELVCRKAHATTFWIVKQLGFMIIDMGRCLSARSMKTISWSCETSCTSTTSPEVAGRACGCALASGGHAAAQHNRLRVKC